MPMTPSGLMVWRGKGTAGSEAENKVSPQVKMRDEPSCDSVKDAGSVFLFSISQWLLPINVSIFVRKSRDSRIKANHCPEYLLFRPHRDKICLPLSTKSSETLKGSTSKAFGPNWIKLPGLGYFLPMLQVGRSGGKGRALWAGISQGKTGLGFEVCCPLVAVAVLGQEVTAILLSSLLLRVIWAVHRLAKPPTV